MNSLRLLFLICCAILTACEQNTASHVELDMDAENDGPVPAGMQSELPHRLEWHHDLQPHEWLAARERMRSTDRERSASDYEQVLRSLDVKYREDRRMLVNRSVELQQQLAEAGIVESLFTLLQGFDSLEPQIEMASYGEQCRLYLHERMHGRSHQEALRELSTFINADR